MYQKGASLLLAAAMTFSAMVPGRTARAAEDSYVTGDQLTAAVVEAPARDSVLPDANQYEYQKQELAAFCHFGPNTFNEIEWGEHYGDRTPGQIFTLEQNFDAEQLVSSLKAAGFQKLIVTAKHHDGFCIWNSAYTDYDVQSTGYADHNYDGMGGDILAEISAACTAHDMDMGLYLSPWDIHDESYGYYDENHSPTDREHDAKDYNDYYNDQLEEILSSDKYGNAGHFNEVWMDGAKGSGANAQDYDFQRWFATIQKYEGKEAGYPADCMLFGAESYSTVRWIGNENGYANEETWSKSIIDRAANTIDSNRTGAQNTFVGYENGNQWTVPEVDARITSGWFWGTRKCDPKSLDELGNMYFNSVGRNAPLLLNVPPNNQGGVDQAILDRVAQFGAAIADTFRVNLAADAAVSASQVRGNALSYQPSNVLDGRDDSFWTVDRGTTTASLLLELKGQKTFDVVSLEESIEFGQRIKEFKVEYSLNGGGWKTFDQGTTVGAKRLCRKAPVTADRLRITVTTSSAEPMLAEVGVFKAHEGFEKSGGTPAGMDVIDVLDKDFRFSNGWNPETGDQYLNGSNTWANAGASFDVPFHGTKVYLVGTVDPNHGTADLFLDGQKVGSIDTTASSRAVGQIIFASEDLSDGPHTLRLVATDKAIGVEALYAINNGGKGMIGIEEPSYTMDEASTLDVKLVRAGGSTGSVTVNVSPNPGSAIQDDYNTELNHVITFADGETVKTARVETRRNTRPTGNQYFTLALSSPDKDLILGFHNVARINILDTETKPVLPTAPGRDYRTETITAGHAHSGFGADKANDNDPDTFWQTGWTDDTGKNVNNRWIEMDLGSVKHVDGIRVLPRQGGKMGDENGTPIRYAVKVRSSTDDEWTTVAQGTRPTTGNWREWYLVDFDQVEARYVRFCGITTYGDTGNDLQMSLAEIRAVGPGTAPEPEGPTKDELAAAAVDAKIDAIGTVTLASEGKITEARTAYEALTESQKALVTQLDLLTAAEAKLAELKKPVEPEVPEVTFPDVKPGDWFYNGVMYSAGKGLMNGLPDGTFGPAVTMTRAQLVQMLYALEGKPVVESVTDQFSDVKDGDWFANAVTWAVEANVTGGVGAGKFAPNAQITRQEMAVMLYAYKGRPEAAGKLDFVDSADIADWAGRAVIWAVDNGLMSSTSTEQLMFSPKSTATRAEAAIIMMNLDLLR